MKNNIAVLVIASLSLLLGACSTIEFVQYEQQGIQPSEEFWHHGTLNGMVEISRPLNLHEVCEGKAWNSVTTELTVYNVLVTSIVPRIPPLVFYTGWTNRVECFTPAIESD